MRIAAVGVLLVAFATPGDLSLRAASPSPPKIVVRLVRDTTFGDALAEQYQRRLPNLDLQFVNAVGSVETVDAIQRGEADLGFTLADVAYFAYLGLSQPPAIGAPAEVRGIAALQLAPIHLLARPGLPVHTVADLVGYRVGVGTALSRQSLLASLLFHAYGLGSEIRQPDRRTDLLSNVDATFATGYYPTPTVTDATAHGARLIPLEGPVAARLRRQYPFVRSVTIPGGTYPGQTTDLVTLGIDRLLVCSGQLDPRLVHELTRVFIEALPRLASSLHTSIRLTNVEQASATPIPLHAGAAQYYRERELAR
jgi:TRAP transporter TAXI family solute receptor